MWAIGGSLDTEIDEVVGETYAFDGGEKLYVPFRLDADGDEVTFAGPAQSLFLKRNDRAHAVTFRICSQRADGTLNCTLFGDTFHICLLYG